jgi:hypothetical protein
MPIDRVNVAHAVINEHGPIFYELIELVIECLQRIGIQASRAVNEVNPDWLNVIVGHTMFLAPTTFAAIRQRARRYVVFQMEALHSQQGFSARFPAYFEFLRTAQQIWDYSRQNIDYLASFGLDNVRYIPIGHSSRLERIANPAQSDIDVLFYGAINPRRRQIIDELVRRGRRALWMFRAYGQERDDYIARAKIQLNIHQFETTQLEQLRLSYLLNNKRFVVSETPDINPYGEGIVACDYKDLVDRCESYLMAGMEAERARIALLGYESLKRVPMAEAVRGALAEVGSPG